MSSVVPVQQVGSPSYFFTFNFICLVETPVSYNKEFKEQGRESRPGVRMGVHLGWYCYSV